MLFIVVLVVDRIRVVLNFGSFRVGIVGVVFFVVGRVVYLVMFKVQSIFEEIKKIKIISFIFIIYFFRLFFRCSKV